jgi:hypothetical protein
MDFCVRDNSDGGECLVSFEFILNLKSQDKKNAHIVWDMRQVYKGEIEEKNQAASSNSTAVILTQYKNLVNG